MTLRGTALVLIGLVPALGASLIAGARKEAAPSHVISAIPCVIRTPGTYCLARDLCYDSLSGNAITVDANDVTIDLDGCRLSCEAGPTSRAVGIFSSQCSAVTIRNGTVQGFHFGAQFCGVNCRDNQVCNVTFADNWYIGLWIEGKQSLAMSNRVENTGGCSLPGFTTPIGMRLVGEGCALINNQVSGFAWRPGTTTEIVGVAIDEAPGAMVAGNRISLDRFLKNSWGIWVNSTGNDGSSSVDVENNYIANFENGCAFLYAQGRMKNNCYCNVATRWRVPEWNCDADQGGNVSITSASPSGEPRIAPAVAIFPASRSE